MREMASIVSNTVDAKGDTLRKPMRKTAVMNRAPAHWCGDPAYMKEMRAMRMNLRPISKISKNQYCVLYASNKNPMRSTTSSSPRTEESQRTVGMEITPRNSSILPIVITQRILSLRDADAAGCVCSVCNARNISCCSLCVGGCVCSVWKDRSISCCSFCSSAFLSFFFSSRRIPLFSSSSSATSSSHGKLHSLSSCASPMSSMISKPVISDAMCTICCIISRNSSSSRVPLPSSSYTRIRFSTSSWWLPTMPIVRRYATKSAMSSEAADEDSLQAPRNICVVLSSNTLSSPPAPTYPAILDTSDRAVNSLYLNSISRSTALLILVAASSPTRKCRITTKMKRGTPRGYMHKHAHAHAKVGESLSSSGHGSFTSVATQFVPPISTQLKPDTATPERSGYRRKNQNICMYQYRSRTRLMRSLSSDLDSIRSREGMASRSDTTIGPTVHA
mmetsp:Transcript_3588/g.7261  ORF Transcript_3588/g.7261 Transcript_3588/m.7261 type:complete len:448 (-) Transcript_3588:2595-3938(-)